MKNKRFVPKLRSFLPAHGILAAVGLTLAFLLGACGTATLTPSSEPIIYQVQTIVAETVTAQATPPPTSTAIATSTPTATPYVNLTAPTPTPTSHAWYGTYSTSYNCDASEFVKDMTVSDGTVMSPGETFVKTWKFRNTGSCMWEEDYLIIFVSGDEMDGEITYLDTTVLAGKRGDASVVLTAPDEEGTYYGYWQLADEDGYTFGDWAYVEIVVEEDATSTPTPTSTPTATQTPTYTPTPTVVETATQTPTPTPTCIPDEESVNEPTDKPTEEPTEAPTEAPTEVPTEEPTAESVETDAILSIIGKWFL
jgi:hypothetical protein